jgi:hypothetical protein
MCWKTLRITHQALTSMLSAHREFVVARNLMQRGGLFGREEILRSSFARCFRGAQGILASGTFMVPDRCSVRPKFPSGNASLTLWSPCNHDQV